MARRVKHFRGQVAGCTGNSQTHEGCLCSGEWGVRLLVPLGGERTGQAEISDFESLGAVVGSGEQNIVRLEVAVSELAYLMNNLEGARGRHNVFHGLSSG